jgi:hypothetical protein
MRLPFFAALLVLSMLAAQAADKEKLGTLPEPPPPVKNYKSPPQPPAATGNDSGALPEPEVTITTNGDTRREEYRLGGRLYMIKVIPKGGRPYYLIDNEGNGEFMKDDFQPSVSPPMWVIKRF